MRSVISSESQNQASETLASSEPGSSRRSLVYPLIIVITGLLSYIPWLGSYGLLDPTDSFFLESGREILEKDQFLLPLNNYVPWLDKPILFFWMVAYSFKFLGISPFAGRLPAALSAIATAVIIYKGCRPILRPPTATLAALIFLSCPLASIIGHVCLTDMTLCALITGSVLYLFKGLEFKSKGNLLSGYIFLALAVLCKGPIAIILCGLALLPLMISLSKNPADLFGSIKRLQPLLGASIILAVNLPWYVMAAIATKGQFLIDFFWTQNFGRMVGTVNHQGPFYFYIPVFFGGFFPWWTVALSCPGTLKNTFLKKNAELNPRRRLLRLCLFWFALVMGLFTAIKTKLPTYILPSLPAFAIASAMQIELISRSGKIRKLLPSAVLITVSILGGAAAIPFLKGYVRATIMQNLWIALPLLISVACCWTGLFRRRMRLFIGSLLCSSLIACAVMVPAGLKTFYKERQIGFSRLVQRAQQDNASIAMVFAEEPSVPWITHRPVSRLMNRDDAQHYMSETSAPHYVLVQKGNLSRLDWFSASARLLDESGKWKLFQVGSLP